jgi:hypothetical protein
VVDPDLDEHLVAGGKLKVDAPRIELNFGDPKVQRAARQLTPASSQLGYSLQISAPCLEQAAVLHKCL